MRWSYDFDTSFKTQQFTVGDQTPFYFNDPNSQYGTRTDGLPQTEFTGGTNTSRKAINTTGGGSIITIGLESDIEGDPLSLQEINVLALIGKTL